MRVQKIAIIGLYVLFRMCEAISDLFQGLFQRHERLDIAGKSMTIRYSISTILLLAFLLITKSLIQSLLYLVVLNFIFVFCYDYVKSKEFETIDVSVNNLKRDLFDAITILKNCIPLFVSGFLLAYISMSLESRLTLKLDWDTLLQGHNGIIIFCLCPVFFMSLLYFNS